MIKQYNKINLRDQVLPKGEGINCPVMISSFPMPLTLIETLQITLGIDIGPSVTTVEYNFCKMNFC